MMRPNVTVDRISFLPHDIKDSILTRLNIKEAARTCILSRSWRFQWHFLSRININHGDFSEVSDVEFVKIVDHILLFHRGLIDKLELLIYLHTRNDIDRWILYVSRNGIKELVIQNRGCEDYDVPSCIFSCSNLTCLDLFDCIVKPPASFKEFGNLTKLSLENVMIDIEVLENVINSCPLLTQLTLEVPGPQEFEAPDVPPPSLKISAPKLVMLRMLGFDHLPRLMNTTLLESAYFEMECCEASCNEDCNIVQLLGSMPILRRLDLKYKALQHLAVGDVPPCLPSVCPIKFLQVSIDFEILQDLLNAFCIFRSSPFLQHLKVWSTMWHKPSISSHGFWNGEHDFSFKFDNLQTVDVLLLRGYGSELKFVEFLLSKAPALKTVDIKFGYSVIDRATGIVTELIRFPRLSPNAQLILPTNWDQRI